MFTLSRRNRGRVGARSRRAAALVAVFMLLATACPGNTPQANLCQTGTPPSNFNPHVTAVELAGSQLYVGGSFSDIRSADGANVASRTRLAMCNVDTGAISGWNPTANDTVWDIEVAGNHIYVAGKFTAIAGTSMRYLVRFDRTTGQIDTSWNPNPNGPVRVVLLSNGGANLFVGGDFTRVSGVLRTRVAKVSTSAGAALQSFNPYLLYTPTSAGVQIRSLALSGTTLYIGGLFDRVNGAVRSSLAAVDNQTGLNTTGFAPSIVDTNPNDPHAIVEDIFLDDNWIYACGDYWVTEGIGSQTSQRQIGRFNRYTGAADTSFLPSTDGGVQACYLDTTHNYFFFGGHFDVVNGAAPARLGRVNTVTGAVGWWNPKPLHPGSNRGVDALDMSPDNGVLYVGGSFTTIGGATRNGLASFVIN